MPFPIGRDADRLRDTVDEIVGIITPIVRVDAVLDDHALICPELVEALRHDSVELVLRDREHTARGTVFRTPDVVHITRIITNQSLSNPLSVLIVADNAVQITEQVLSDLLPLRFHGLQVNIGFAGQQPILIEMIGSLRHKSVGLLLGYVPVAVRRRTLDTVYGGEIVNIPILVFGKSDRFRHAVDEVIGMIAPVMRVDTVLDDHAVIRSELVEALRHDSVELVLRDREHTARGTVDRIPNVVDISLVVPDQPLCHRDTVFVVADPSVCIMYQSGYRRSGSISSRGCRQHARNRKSQQTQRRQPSHNFFHIVSPFAPHLFGQRECSWGIARHRLCSGRFPHNFRSIIPSPTHSVKPLPGFCPLPVTGGISPEQVSRRILSWRYTRNTPRFLRFFKKLLTTQKNRGIIQSRYGLRCATVSLLRGKSEAARSFSP